MTDKPLRTARGFAMTSAKIAALAVDLGVQVGSDLLDRPVRRVESLPWHSARLPASLPPNPAESATPLVPVEDVDELLEYTPTTADFRRVMSRKPWHAVMLMGPARRQKEEGGADVWLWGVKVKTTTNPADRKRHMQDENFLSAIRVHAVLWCDTKEAAERLKVMIVDAFDFRHYSMARGWHNVPPGEAVKVANEVAKRAHIVTFDEAERARRIDQEVRQQLAEIASSVRRIGRG